MKLLTTTLTLILALGIASDADARRRRAPTVDRTPALAPVCNSGGVVVDCITFLPITTDEEAEEPTSDIRPDRERYNVVTLGIANDELISPVPPNLSLNTTRHTLQQFNDSRVAGLHDRVAELINTAVRNTPRPVTAARYQRLIDELQIRLDPLADGGNANRVIDRYWTLSYEDRLIVYVKPPNNLHILTYTIRYAD